MEALKKHEYKLIKIYKKQKKEEIVMYFFNKCRNDVINIVYSKICTKFTSIPFEKGDLFHLVWNSIKKSLDEFEDGDFNSIVVKNCYWLTIKEVKKYLNNSELIMNISDSFESYINTPGKIFDRNLIEENKDSRNEALEKLINNACEYVNLYPQPTIKKVIYLKSLGYSISEIARIIRKSRYHVDHLLKLVEDMVKDMNF